MTDENGKQEHQTEAGAALKELESSREHAGKALEHIDRIGALLLRAKTPQEIENWHGNDPVAADEHMQAVYADIAQIRERAKLAKKQAHIDEKLCDKLEYGLKKLYGPLHERAEEEREKRWNRQKPLPFPSPPGAAASPAAATEEQPKEPRKRRG